LGAGVINIEISDDQIEDAIQLAVEYYQEFHFDGIARDYYSHRITGTTVTVASAAGFAVDDNVTTSQGGIAKIIGIAGNVISLSRNEGVVWKATQTLTNGTVSSVISAVSLGDIDNRSITLDDSVINVLKIINYTTVMNSKDPLFSVQFQMGAPEILRMVQGGAGTGGIGYYYGMMNYLAQMDFVLSKQKSFRFNRRSNLLYLDIGWESEVNIGDYMVVEMYRTLDPENYTEVYNDMWLKKYGSALMKRTWGANLKKYEGMQLPGGLTYNGQKIYDEAMTEIKDLEEELVQLQPPMDFMVG
jgi:hypothetical protein